MSAFRDQSWEQRFGKLGDEAEGHFESYAETVLKRGYVRYGLNRPPIKLHALPKRICYTPDYLMSKCFVEVQGVGRDQRVKLKVSKHGALHWWHDLRVGEFEGVNFYLWDSHNERECMIPLDALDDLLDNGTATLGSFHEGKAYFDYPADAIFEAAA